MAYPVIYFARQSRLKYDSCMFETLLEWVVWETFKPAPVS
jgi:hypothetical protein